jgi:hypothetical protein
VQLAILIGFLDAKYNGSAGPFNILYHDAHHAGIALYPTIKVCQIPCECRVLDQAIDWIEGALQKEQTTTLFIFTSSFSGFPDYDIILVAKTPHFLHKFGLQIKLTKAYPKHTAHHWFNKSYLVRGAAPSKASVSNHGWNYLNESEIRTFLGLSLFQVYPSQWPPPPEV